MESGKVLWIIYGTAWSIRDCKFSCRLRCIAMIFYRFPFEVNMVFFSEPRDIGIDNNFYPKNNVTKMIMISVLGEVRFGRED